MVSFGIDEIQIKFMFKIQVIYISIDDSSFSTKSLKVCPWSTYFLNQQP